jgi:YggT family protein
MHSLLILIDTVLDLYTWVLVIWVVLSWLIAFNIVNTHNRFVFMLSDILYRATEPVLRPLRRVLPNLGGLDIAPLVLVLVIFFVRNLLREYFW